ncbi:MAG: DUF2088 domain-containing protein [Armatimonadetes bacterium]|nr:DUF2088 domain-containing protein [Armatimonadota bacterium]
MLLGVGSEDRHLTEPEIRALLEAGVAQIEAAGKRVLVIIPDGTRSGPLPLCFRLLVELLGRVAARLDFLVALGTHPPMSEAQLYRHLGITPEQRASTYRHVGIFQHDWRRDLTTLGTIPAAELAALTGGRLSRDVPVQINARLLEYDRLLLCGPVFPHEAMGFSGGNKYLFPGVSGPAVIHCFHWLSALITNRALIGRQPNPVRAVVDRAAQALRVPRWCLSLVTADPQHLHGLYFGTPEESQAAAAALSARVHVTRVARPFHTVVSVMPAMYEDLWTAGKGMYKVEPVVADGGTVIIYAPRVRCFSYTHGALLERSGYHVRDYFLARWEEYQSVPGCILAHSTLVKGDGTYLNGVERPRVNVVLATGIPREVCARATLGYRDPATFRPEEWTGREAEGILLVPQAGERLYRLQ